MRREKHLSLGVLRDPRTDFHVNPSPSVKETFRNHSDASHGTLDMLSPTPPPAGGESEPLANLVLSRSLVQHLYQSLEPFSFREGVAIYESG